MALIKKVLSVLGDIVSVFLFVALFISVAVLLITKMCGGVPQFLGYRLFVISTGSMYPALEVGDVILSKSYETGETIEPGDILTYEGLGQTEGLLITHRLVSYTEDDGKRVFILKGDFNNTNDSPVSEERVVAVCVCKLRIFGYIYNCLQSSWGLPALGLIIFGFILVEVLDFRKTLEQKKNDEKKNISQK